MQTNFKQTDDYKSKIIKLLESAPNNTYRPWTEFEETMLTKYYGKKDINYIAKALDRKPGAITRKAYVMGLHYDR